MNTTLVYIGKTDSKYLETGILEYTKRIEKYLPVKTQIIPDLKNRKKLSIPEQRQVEGKLLIDYFNPSDIVVLLDENGSQYTSVTFAEQINKFKLSGKKNLVFVIGGPYGFSDEIYSRANEKISLSPMTFSHQMVRLIFLEQLYRACTILRNEPYHHE
jgi:23S rRNA (pseudouridine1915-N3)-methyltransferase